jgi:endonuclease YncB( thermonuclease family)
MVGLSFLEVAAGAGVFALIAAPVLPWKRITRLLRRPKKPSGRHSASTRYSGRPIVSEGFLHEQTRYPAVQRKADRTPRVLLGVKVVDGDTLDDTHTGIRYRLTNIDAPETGSNARCYSERIQGERAQQAAESILRAAKQVEARPTGKIDKYGRTVAYILVDGQDLGVSLIRGGFARPWADAGYAHWCGDRGALLQMAKELGVDWNCRTCGARHVCGARASTPPPEVQGESGLH